jgi:DNA-binding NtrC family response regulator
LIQKVSDRIIVVDDMPDIADNIAARLRLAGFKNIAVYTDPHEALKKIIIDNIRPAIVIVDFNMPGLTGVQLLDEIDKLHPEIDGVVVTGDMSAAMESPHRYRVFDKAKNFYRELISHTLGIIRSHV